MSVRGGLSLIRTTLRNAAGSVTDPDTYRSVPRDLRRAPAFVAAALRAAWRKVTGGV